MIDSIHDFMRIGSAIAIVLLTLAFAIEFDDEK